MIELNNVKKSYGSTKALQCVSLTLETGKIIGIAGENGSGKSTLLKSLAGVSPIDSGSILIDGKPVSRKDAERIAYLPDADMFYPYFTVGQMFAYYRSQFADFNEVKAKEVLDFLEVPLSSKMKTLSKGMRGRAKMAATLGRESRYYLMDEPFSGLDPMVRGDLVKGLLRFTDLERQTLILSTHEIREVETLLDELVLLKGGNVLAHRQLDDIRDETGQDTVEWMTKGTKAGAAG
ncbi:spermidine/putrescine ABC transporter ATP-binding protein [Planococcus salinarum]|uniref:Spermidine/putrescine ABC transporter ATP-binding protein n=1 Tax=Planococcus salinarum TaxID=622695 RepID=A0ABX3D2I6_9BACL|nr:ABC transporter ATP-binding protein [Planococcus salinarum]OHX53882.1 spermidine/putrescine ABC transporter ATP-binding protein [Planococcus salinarum]TAA72638.1 ABC transporter ATP-binding protein [Planococcus salinarum]